MTTPDREVRVESVSRTEGAAAGASIWARATEQRDGRHVTAAEAADGIHRRLDLPGAEVSVARQAGEPVGFALVAPRDDSMELFYLAVDPAAWGGGVARELLAHVEDGARAAGRDTLELWVLDDNSRAIDLYERSEWTRTDDTKRDQPRDRVERRFVRAVPAAAR